MYVILVLICICTYLDLLHKVCFDWEYTIMTVLIQLGTAKRGCVYVYDLVDFRPPKGSF